MAGWGGGKGRVAHARGAHLCVHALTHLTLGPLLSQIIPKQNAKVAIKISDRSKMDPHTHEREVTLSGSYAGIQLACAMISEKLAANRARASDGGGPEDELLLDEHGMFY